MFPTHTSPQKRGIDDLCGLRLLCHPGFREPASQLSIGCFVWGTLWKVVSKVAVGNLEKPILLEIAGFEISYSGARCPHVCAVHGGCFR